MINIENNNIWLEIISQGDKNTLKKIIENLIQKENYIISYSSRGYLFLNNLNTRYIHHSSKHTKGNFGKGLDSLQE